MKILPLKYLVFVILLTSALAVYSSAYNSYVVSNTATTVESDTALSGENLEPETTPSTPDDSTVDETTSEQTTDDTASSSQNTEQKDSTSRDTNAAVDKEKKHSDASNQDSAVDMRDDQGKDTRFDRADLNCDTVINDRDLEIILGYYNRKYTPLVRSPDINNDGIVAQADLGELLAVYGLCDSDCPADFNADGAVDDCDLSIIKAYYNQPFTGMQSPDFNADGMVDQHDLGEFLAVYP